MKYGVYCMYDKSAKTFGQMTIDTNDQTARRNFAFGINHSDQLAFMAKDFELYHIANMESDSGKVEAVTPIERVCAASDVLGDYE